MIARHFAILLPLAQYSYDSISDSSPFFYDSLDSATMAGLFILVVVSLIGAFVHYRMMACVKKFSTESCSLTGAQVARRMLDAHGLHHVQITHVSGQLTDHYNPVSRTVNLSDSVFREATVAAMAVAAHECGHAVQHAAAYPWLAMRSRMVPLVNIGAHLGQFVLMAGLVLIAAGGSTMVAWFGLILFASSTIFALVTLPVEFDASRRALAWLNRVGLASPTAHRHAESALNWAAMTYVAAALSSIAMLAYYALRLLSASSRSRR